MFQTEVKSQDVVLLAAETQSELLVRAGGNPLYAEQFARVLREQGEVAELPETVQGMIAARLDLLRSEEKAALQDAAVLGRSFWAGGVATVSGLVNSWNEQRIVSQVVQATKGVDQAVINLVTRE